MAFLCTNPGQEENDGPLFSLPWAQIFLRSVSTAALGGTRAAVKAAVAIAQDRVSTNTGKASKTDPILMASIAKAYAQMEEMELVLRHSFDDMMDGAAAGRPLTLERRALNRYHSLDGRAPLCRSRRRNAAAARRPRDLHDAARSSSPGSISARRARMSRMIRTTWPAMSSAA